MASSKGQPEVISDFGQIWDDMKSRPLLEIVGVSSLSTVGTVLNAPNPVSKGWEALADKLGYSRDKIEMLRQEGNKMYQKCPGELLLETWGGRGSGSTLQVLEQALIDIDRLDVLEELQKAAKDECTLSVTICIHQKERSMTLPGVWGMLTLGQALEGALEETGLRTDDFEIQGSESESGQAMSWTTKARECKGIHLRLVKKKLPQPRVDVTRDEVCWEELTKIPGFHHNIPDDPAAIHTFMFNYLRDEGWYVIRKCENNKLAVSVTYLGEIRHFRIGHTDGRFYFRKDEFQASSLHELIETYKWNDLPAKCGRLNGSAHNTSNPPVPDRERGVRLLKPV
ncbi:PREDICTED: uncharacterized protein LOC109477229 [Branchiostoma belcheri]|uniref:Uncharacterized protein LOC109477229 n=1 Tax=Branchiostoma belcheri TaxID=7741 RepID=A0A6P4ZSE4_BRABE|nr:PREDICTED: uncharacterized protein LOC109477229 [Branchiostoma belcheri]